MSVIAWWHELWCSVIYMRLSKCLSHGVEIMVKDLCKKVVEVSRISDGVISDALRLMHGHAPQIERRLEE